uniref:Putative secreted protein n=1 Tax=Ixodes scapularis TaxID=6945 RepID=A0A4D5RAG5_IXOSC
MNAHRQSRPTCSRAASSAALLTSAATSSSSGLSQRSRLELQSAAVHPSLGQTWGNRDICAFEPAAVGGSPLG